MNKEFWKIVDDLGRQRGQRRDYCVQEIREFLCKKEDCAAFFCIEFDACAFGKCDEWLRHRGFKDASVALLADVLDNSQVCVKADRNLLATVADPELRCIFAKKVGLNARDVPLSSEELTVSRGLCLDKPENYRHTFFAVLVAHMRDNFDPCVGDGDGSFWKSWKGITGKDWQGTNAILDCQRIFFVREDEDWMPFGLRKGAVFQDLMRNAFPLRSDAAIEPVAAAIKAILDAGSQWSDIAALSEEELLRCLGLYVKHSQRNGLGRIMRYCGSQVVDFVHDLAKLRVTFGNESLCMQEANRLDPSLAIALKRIGCGEVEPGGGTPRLRGWCTKWRWTPPTWEKDRGYWSLSIRGFRLRCTQPQGGRLALKVFGKSLAVPYVYDAGELCVGSFEVPDIPHDLMRRCVPGPVVLSWEGLNQAEIPKQMGWAATLNRQMEEYDVLIFRFLRREMGPVELILPNTEIPAPVYTVSASDMVYLAIRKSIPFPANATSRHVDLPGTLGKTHAVCSWQGPSACCLGSVDIGLRQVEFTIDQEHRGSPFLASEDDASVALVHSFPRTATSDAVYRNGELINKAGNSRLQYGRYQVRRRRSRVDLLFIPKLSVRFSQKVFQLGETADGEVRVEESPFRLSWAGAHDKSTCLKINTLDQALHFTVWNQDEILANILLQVPRFIWGLRREDEAYVPFSNDTVIPVDWLTAGASICVSVIAPVNIDLCFPDINDETKCHRAHLYQKMQRIGLVIGGREFSVPVQRTALSVAIDRCELSNAVLLVRARINGLPEGERVAGLVVLVECLDAPWRNQITLRLRAGEGGIYTAALDEPLPELKHCISPKHVRVLNSNARQWPVDAVVGDISFFGTIPCPSEKAGVDLYNALLREHENGLAANFKDVLSQVNQIPAAEAGGCAQSLAKVLCFVKRQGELDVVAGVFVRELAAAQGAPSMLVQLKEELIGLALQEGVRSNLVKLVADIHLSLEDMDLSQTHFSVGGENPLWDVWLPLGCFAAITADGWNSVTAEYRLGSIEPLEVARNSSKSVNVGDFIQDIEQTWLTPYLPSITTEALEDWQDVIPVGDDSDVDRSALWRDFKPYWIGRDGIPSLLSAIEMKLRPRVLRNGSCRGTVREWILWSAFAQAVQMRLKAHRIIDARFRAEDQLRSCALLCHAKSLYERLLCLVEAVIVWKTEAA